MLDSIGNLLTLAAVAIAIYATVRRRVPQFARWVVDLFMVRSPAEPNNWEDDEPPVSPAKANAETAETPQLDVETRAEIFCFGETVALARLVAAGKVGLTDAVKIGAEAKSGEKYQRRSRQIKQAVEQLKQKFGPLTHEQQATREQLELPKR
jgi:hypothetical protein